MQNSTVFWIRLDCCFAEKTLTVRNILQTPDFKISNLGNILHNSNFGEI